MILGRGGIEWVTHSQYQQNTMPRIWRGPGESHVEWPSQGGIVAGGRAWLKMRVRVSILFRFREDSLAIDCIFFSFLNNWK